MTTGENLVSIMENKGISKRELSRKTNLSPSTITRITRGDMNGSLHTWNTVCQAVGIRIDEVIDVRTNE